MFDWVTHFIFFNNTVFSVPKLLCKHLVHISLKKIQRRLNQKCNNMLLSTSTQNELHSQMLFVNKIASCYYNIKRVKLDQTQSCLDS